jgi:glycosyltransferase involved in cell wall biosynthesis
MKICLLAPASNPHTRKIAYSLTDLGYEITVCTFHGGELPGIAVKTFPPLLKPFGKINYLLSVQQIRGYLQDIKPDILHSHYVSSYGVIGALTKFSPHIVSVWGRDIYDAPRNMFHRFFIERALRDCAHIFSTSETMAIQTRKYSGQKKITVTPFGVDLAKFFPRKKRHKGFTIGIAKGLYPKYGIRFLIEAFFLSMKENSSAKLHIAGRGPQMEFLVKQCEQYGIADRVTFFGFIQPDRIPEFLGDLDIFCMPSIEESESFGVAALEAQACGIPVIASRIGGLHETVGDGKTGFLVPPKDAKALSEKIRYLYDNRERYNEMRKNCVQFVKEKYDWAKNLKIITDVYSDILGKSS